MSTLGVKIDSLQSLREQKRALESQIKVLSEQMADIELELIKQMDSQGIERSTGKAATVSISTQTRPSVDDWDAFYAYIRKNKYFHLLEKRPSVSGCNELFETKGKIPGVVPYVQRRLNVRSI